MEHAAYEPFATIIISVQDNCRSRMFGTDYSHESAVTIGDVQACGVGYSKIG